MASFTDLLDRRAEEIERPPLLPIGIYSAKVTKPHAVAEITGKDGTIYERIEFPCAIVAAIEVDEQDLEDFGNVANQPFRRDWLMDTTEGEDAKRARTEFEIKTFLEALEVFSDGMTLGEGMAEAVGAEFAVEIGHRPDPNDADRVYLDVKRSLSLSDVE